MLFRLFAPVLFLAFSLTSCDKDDPNPPEQNDDPVKYQLKSVHYETFNAKGDYAYNDDSTVKRIAFSHPNRSYTTDFEYQDKKVSKVSISNSLYVTNFQYDGTGKMTKMEQNTIAGGSTGHKFIYTYLANGTVKEMKYYDKNEAGDKLVYTNTYEYNANGQLAKVTSVSNQSTIIFTIDSYSDQCSFNPWTFISINLSELYQIYNYPLLSKMDALPKKITQTNIVGGTSKVAKVFDTDYTITDKKLIKSVGSVVFPDAPQYNNSSIVSYHY